MTIDLDSSGSASAIAFSLYNDTTGAAITGHTWNDVGAGVTDELKFSCPATRAWTNVLIANITEWGLGQYEYQPTATDTATAGAVGVRAKTSLSSLEVQWDRVVASATAASIADAVLDEALSGHVAAGSVGAAFATILADLIDIGGLLHKNSMVDNTTHINGSVLATGRLRVFTNAAALSAATPGAANDADGEIRRYTITGTQDGNGRMATFDLERTLP